MENNQSVINALVTPKGPPPAPFKETPSDQEFKAKVTQALDDSRAPDLNVRRGGEEAIRVLCLQNGFSTCLLDIICDEDSSEFSRKMSAAIILKNVWNSLAVEDIPKARKQLLTTLVEAKSQLDQRLLNLLAITFRTVCELYYPDEWPSLVDELELEKSNSLGWFMAVHALTKRFEYFQTPTIVEECSPEELEEISEKLILRIMLDATSSTDSPNRFVLKTIFRATRSYYPKTLLQETSSLSNLLCATLKRRTLQEDPELLRNQKRAILLISNLLGRHKHNMSSHVGVLTEALVEWVTDSSKREGFEQADEELAMLDRVEALAFEFLAESTEDAERDALVNWSTLFSTSTGNACSGILCSNESDAELWIENPEEYLWRNFDFETDAQESMSDELADGLGVSKSARKALVGLLTSRSGRDIEKTLFEQVDQFGRFILYGIMLKTIGEEEEPEISTVPQALGELVDFLESWNSERPLVVDDGDDVRPINAMLVVNALWAVSQTSIELLESSNLIGRLINCAHWYLQCRGEDDLLKPVRMSAGFFVCSILERADELGSVDQVPVDDILNTCISVGDTQEEDAGDQLDGMEYVMISKVLESPWFELSKEMYFKLASHLISHCKLELQKPEEDLTNSRAYVCLGSLVARVMEEDDFYEDPSSGLVNDTYRSVYETILSGAKEVSSSLWSQPLDEENSAPYIPETTSIMLLLCRVAPVLDEESKTAIAQLRAMYFSNFASWSSILAMLDGEWEQILSILRSEVGEGDDGEAWVGALVECCDHFLVEVAEFRASRAACQFLLAMFNSKTPAFLVECETHLSQVSAAAFARLMTGTESSALQTSLMLVLCHCYVANSGIASTSMNDQGVLDDFLRCYIDVTPSVVGPISSKIVVLAGIAILNELEGQHETSSGRRLLSKALEVVVQKVIDIQSGDIEVQRKEHMEAIQESQEDESDEEEQSSDEEEEEETEAEFRARYAAIAQDLEDDRSEDGVDEEEAEEEMLVDYGDRDGFQDVDVVQLFRNWYNTHGAIVEENLNRATKSKLESIFC